MGEQMLELEDQVPWKSVRGFWKGRRASWQKEVSPACSWRPAWPAAACGLLQAVLSPEQEVAQPATQWRLGAFSVQLSGLRQGGSRTRSWCA